MIFDDGPDLSVILTTIRATPRDGYHWLRLAGWLWDIGRDDEPAAVRVFWQTLRENLRNGVSLEETLAEVERHAAKLSRRARKAEGRKWDGRAD